MLLGRCCFYTLSLHSSSFQAPKECLQDLITFFLTVHIIPTSDSAPVDPQHRDGESEREGGDQLLECDHYAATPIEMLCQCVAIVWAWVRLPLTIAAVLMTKSVWGSGDNGAVEPPQSAGLMLPFQQACSAAECARLPGKGKWRRARGLGPIKTLARVRSPTLIILDLSHLSTLCKYFSTPPQVQLRTCRQETATLHGGEDAAHHVYLTDGLESPRMYLFF